MFRKTVFLILLVAGTFLIISGTCSFAADIEIYTNDGEGVEPNVLIIFDNSDSMNNTVTESSDYDKDTIYSGTYNSATVYYRSRGHWDPSYIFRDSVATVACVEARTALETEGFYNGKIQIDTQCGGNQNEFLRTGNYLNYLSSASNNSQSRLGVAIGSMQSFINTTPGLRFGAMIFNTDEGGQLLREVRDMTPQNQSDLHTAIGGLSATTWTPLAETLYEAGLYFKGAASHFNPSVNYTSPIEVWCQKNYVVIISDGESTKDRNNILQSLGNNGDVDGDFLPAGDETVNYVGGDNDDSGALEDEGSDYLDDVVRYLYDSDLRGDLQDRQNIVTYALGFSPNHQLLEDTATNGRGRYYYVHNSQTFRERFQDIIQEILEESASFTAPVVPISQMEKTTSGNKIYLALFKPTENAFWKGNIKKFSIATETVGNIQEGDILDANGDRATDDQGHILDTAVSFWGSADPDGGETDAGGVGEVLLGRTTPRNIYTWLDSNERPLTHPNNAFHKGNPKLTAAMLQVADDTEKDRIVDLTYGLDAYDEDLDFLTAEKRRWILGSFLHSRPVVVHYDETTSVIFAGANDGMLHAFLDSDGSELWAFVPPDLVGKLKLLNGAVLEYFVDGAPRAAIIDNDMDGVVEPLDGDQVILVFGERRGGNHYYGLDVTYPNEPKYLWDISPDLADFSEMGQSWGTPVIGQLRIGIDDRMCVFLGGGYDTNQDDDPVVGSDTMGRGIYVVDLFDGTLVWKYTNADNPEMAYSIPSDIAVLDTNEYPQGYMDRLYVGDAGGQMWRADIADYDPINWTVKRIFDDSASGRKIFYPPDVVIEYGYEMLFWGTGDRVNPKNETIINRIYGLKDRDPLAPLTDTDLVDVTDNLVQDGTDQQKADTLSDLDSHEGWYIELNENPGEKVLAPTIVYFGTAYLTTFTPTAGAPADPCYIGVGTGRLYALDYMTAAAVLDLDESGGDLEKSDRSEIIGTAIPSGMVIAIVQGQGSSYIGVGGGISTSDVVNLTGITRIYWRQLLQ
jgi:type IV pilus assembly protein PilY1